MLGGILYVAPKELGILYRFTEQNLSDAMDVDKVPQLLDIASKVTADNINEVRGEISQLFCGDGAIQ